MPKQPPIGVRAEIEKTVQFENTLTHFMASLPPVLTTPNMIGWMEFACLKALEPFCEGDEVTVGTAIHVSHRAPTGIGSKVRAEAVLERVEGRFYIFRVTAHDERQMIGDGLIHRAFVSVGKFMGKTKNKG
jgi:fluoroacetyl-CoA thioesterase